MLQLYKLSTYITLYDSLN